MKRRNVPRLAAAFVVTIAAGCGEAPPQPRPPMNPPAPEEPQMNPPPPQPSATGTTGFATPPAGTGTATAAAPQGLPEAPSGWHVEANDDGSCTAYGPDPCNHPGCNPPPPRRVACPPGTARKPKN